MLYFSHVPRITWPKNYVPMSKGVLCSPRADRQTHRQTDRHKVNTEDTLSGFQEFFLQPIMKDRSKKNQPHFTPWYMSFYTYISMDLAMYMYCLWSFNDIPDVIHYIIFPPIYPTHSNICHGSRPWCGCLLFLYEDFENKYKFLSINNLVNFFNEKNWF